MRNFVLLIIAVSLMAYSPDRTEKFQAAGHYNSIVPGAGSRTSNIGLALWSKDQLPLYTKLDTIDDAGVDTFKEKLVGDGYKSVYTWVHVNGITGTNTSCVVKLWVSADSGRGIDFVPIYTATVTSTNPVGYCLINSGNGWPYTNWRWTFTGSGTQRSTWYSGFMPRFQ